MASHILGDTAKNIVKGMLMASVPQIKGAGIEIFFTFEGKHAEMSNSLHRLGVYAF